MDFAGTSYHFRGSMGSVNRRRQRLRVDFAWLHETDSGYLLVPSRRSAIYVGSGVALEMNERLFMAVHYETIRVQL